MGIAQMRRSVNVSFGKPRLFPSIVPKIKAMTMPAPMMRPYQWIGMGPNWIATGCIGSNSICILL